MTSLSIIQPGDVDLDAVQSWVSDILQTKGADIYRMKGVLSIADTEQKFVYQVLLSRLSIERFTQRTCYAMTCF